MLKLKLLNKDDIKEQYDFVFNLKSENGFENEYYQMVYKTFELMVDLRERNREGIDLPQGFVPFSQYFLWDDDKIVGLFNLRHHLNDFLREGPGHIGFCIKEEYRGKKYATNGLALALKEIVTIDGFNDTEVYMSCNVTNLASLKVQLENNATVEEIKDDHFLLRVKV